MSPMLTYWHRYQLELTGLIQIERVGDITRISQRRSCPYKSSLWLSNGIVYLVLILIRTVDILFEFLRPVTLGEHESLKHLYSIMSSHQHQGQTL